MRALSIYTSLALIAAFVSGALLGAAHLDLSAAPRTPVIATVGGASSATSWSTVLMVGDSLTAGVGASSPDRAWPHDMVHDLGLFNSANAVYAAPIGLSGDDSAQLRNTLVGLSLTTHPALIVVEAVTNDWGHNHTLARFQSDYAALIAALMAGNSGAQLVCLTGWPQANDPVNALGLTLDAYDALIPALCAGGLTVNIAPLASVAGNRSTYDGYHPSDAGYTAIASAITDKLEAQVAKTR